MACCITGCNNKVTCVGVRFLDQKVWRFYCDEHIKAHSVDVARVSDERCLVQLLVNERKAYDTLDKMIEQVDPAEITRCPDCKRHTPSEDEDSCLVCQRMLSCKTWCDPDEEERRACDGPRHPEETDTYAICAQCASTCSLCGGWFCGQPDCDGIDPPTGYATEDSERICIHCREGR